MFRFTNGTKSSSKMEDGELKIAILHPLFSILDLAVICVDRDWAEIAAQNDNNPVTQVCSTDLAYVIYTSSSSRPTKRRPTLSPIHFKLPVRHW